jgi:hypothetical protein
MTYFFALLESLANVVCTAAEPEAINVKSNWLALLQHLREIISRHTSEKF